MTALKKASEVPLDDIAKESRRRFDEETKILDRGATRFLIRVTCKVEGVTFTPRLKVQINGLFLAEEINDAGETPNRAEVWFEVPVRSRGPDPVGIVLQPVDGAERFFRTTKIKACRYVPAYYRNSLETQGQAYEVPPAGDSPMWDARPHLVRARLEPRRGRRLRRLKASDIPRWQAASDPAAGEP